MIRCAISNTAPNNPVVGATTGLVYERSLIEKSLADNDNKCPVTGVGLKKQDLIPLKLDQPQVNPPRSLDGTSIPSLLVAFQNEWDAMALETFKLRQTLEKTRRELAQALYQHDAACRVVARLAKERDEARAALATVTIPLQTSSSSATTTNGSAAPSEAPSSKKQKVAEAKSTAPQSAGIVPLTVDEKKLITEVGDSLIAARASKRKAAASSGGVSELSSNVFYSGETSLVSIDVDEEAGLIAVGSLSGNVTVLSRSTAKIERQHKPSENYSVSCVRLARAGKLVLTSCSDNKLRIVNANNHITAASLKASATDCCEHATHEFSFVADAKGSWSLVRLDNGVIAATGTLEGVTQTSTRFCIDAHPDGKVFAMAGLQAGFVSVWDMLSGSLGANLQSSDAAKLGPASSLDFSENGTSLAVCHKTSGVVKIWDMRKPNDAIQSFPAAEDKTRFVTAAFDMSGQSLYLGGNVGTFQVRNVSRSGVWPVACEMSTSTTSSELLEISAGRGSFFALSSTGVVTEWK